MLSAGRCFKVYNVAIRNKTMLVQEQSLIYYELISIETDEKKIHRNWINYLPGLYNRLHEFLLSAVQRRSSFLDVCSNTAEGRMFLI